MRPLFSVVLVPSAPMNDEMLSTAGSASKHLHQFLLLLASSMRTRWTADACEMPWMMPGVLRGEKALGNGDVKHAPSAPASPRATSSVIVWKPSTNFSVRP